ncbi:hydrolase [Luteitalea sp. TBR-22]|nr:hydrolase [Luteitalea sp. TBR-22]
MDTMVAAPAAAALTGRAEARQDAATAGAAPRDLPRDLAPTRADLGSNFELVGRLDASPGYPASFLSGRFSSIDAFVANGRQLVLDGYHYRPAAVDPAPEVVDRYEGPDYVREKVVFSTTPAFRVPAYVFIPKGLRGRAPAIVDLHSHGGMFLFGKEKVIDFGRNHPAMVKYHADNYESRPTATALVKRGYVVITIDAFMFGERRVLMDGDLGAGWERSAYTLDDVTRLNRVCAARESTLAKSLTVLGTSWPAIVAWDDMRTVDYLASRPEVDAARIGCVGVSFGGWRSLFLAALDTRIAAGCVVGFMSTIRSMLQRHVDTHSWVHFPPGLYRQLDLPDVATLTAPRPLLVQQCRRDGLYPLSGMEAAVRGIEEVYRRANIADRFTAMWYDVPHEFNKRMQDDAFTWLDRQLRP